MRSLIGKKCVPCEGRSGSLGTESSGRTSEEPSGSKRGVQPFTAAQIKDYLAQLKTEWEIEAFRKIKKQFKFKNFKEAIAFVNKVADLAEQEGHHPDISLHGYNRVEIELSTHAIGGLSENDFILAAKIDQLFSLI